MGWAAWSPSGTTHSLPPFSRKGLLREHYSSLFVNLPSHHSASPQPPTLCHFDAEMPPLFDSGWSGLTQTASSIDAGQTARTLAWRGSVTVRLPPSGAGLGVTLRSGEKSQWPPSQANCRPRILSTDDSRTLFDFRFGQELRANPNGHVEGRGAGRAGRVITRREAGEWPAQRGR